jgi:hypothetical protein
MFSKPTRSNKSFCAALPGATQNRMKRVRSRLYFAPAKIAIGLLSTGRDFSPLVLRATLIPCMLLRQHCGDRQSHVSIVCQSKTKASGGAPPAAPSRGRRRSRTDPVRAGPARAQKRKGRRGDASWLPLDGSGMAQSIGAVDPNVECHPVIDRDLHARLSPTDEIEHDVVRRSAENHAERAARAKAPATGPIGLRPQAASASRRRHS